MKKYYGHTFYKDRHQKTVYSANTILSIVVDALPKLHSAVDFGCGVGTFLSVLKEKGAEEIQGIDGPWVNRDLLEIPQQNFRQVNLEDKIELHRRYDLAISLEVAEHLRPEAAETFVESLVNASDFILFSAAIPFQGGKDHNNEQWPDYWEALFNERGYDILDIVRRKIWDEKEIPTWYRQNTLMFVKQERVNDLRMPGPDNNGHHSPVALVHPETYDQLFSVRGSLKLFRRAIKKWFKKKFSKTS